MKKTLSLSVMALLAVSLVLPIVFATSVGSGIGVDVTTEDFPPQVWMCDNRIVADDNVQWGRITQGSDPIGGTMLERINNYAFEGEKIKWKVLVMDKNKIDQNIDVYATIGDVQGEGNDIEVNCQRVGGNRVEKSCNARILEEEVEWNPDLMDYFECTLTVETPESMYGEYWITVEAEDGDGLLGTMDENEYFFLNPEIRLSVDGDLTFEDVRPGTEAYSDTLLVGNDADDGSGVLMDMFISGTDFYDSSSSGARCPSTNQLALNGVGPNGVRHTGTAIGDDTGFRYFVTNGAYSSYDDLTVDTQTYDTGTFRAKDTEGYLDIQYGDHWDRTVYDEAEILQSPVKLGGVYYAGNILAPGAEMALTFKLDLPEPCNGDFDTGAIYFWGEAI